MRGCRSIGSDTQTPIFCFGIVVGKTFELHLPNNSPYPQIEMKTCFKFISGVGGPQTHKTKAKAITKRL